MTINVNLATNYAVTPASPSANVVSGLTQAFVDLAAAGGGTLTINPGTYDMGTYSTAVGIVTSNGLSNTVVSAVGATFQATVTANVTPTMFLFNDPNNVTIDGMAFKGIGSDITIDWRGPNAIALFADTRCWGFKTTAACYAQNVVTFVKVGSTPRYSMMGLDISGTVEDSYFAIEADYDGRFSKANLVCNRIRRAFVGYGARDWNLTITCNPFSVGSNELILLVATDVATETVKNNTIVLNVTNNLALYVNMVQFLFNGTAGVAASMSDNTVTVNVTNPTLGPTGGLFRFSHEVTGTPQATTVKTWQRFTLNGNIVGTYTDRILDTTTSDSTGTTNSVSIARTLGGYQDTTSFPTYFVYTQPNNIVVDRVRELTTSTGTGDMTLNGTLNGFQKFVVACGNNDTFYGHIYSVDASGIRTTEWETGQYTYNKITNVIQRTTVHASSNSNTAVNFSAGTKHIVLSMTANQAGQFLRDKLASISSPAPPPSTNRDPLKQPFNSNSIWNTPVGTGAQYVSAATSQGETLGNPNRNNPNSGSPGSTGPNGGSSVAEMPLNESCFIFMTPAAQQFDIVTGSWSGNRCGQTGGTLVSGAPIGASYVHGSTNGNDPFAVLMSDGHTITQGEPFTRCTAGTVATAAFSYSMAPDSHWNTDLYAHQGSEVGAQGGSGMSSVGGLLRVGEMRPGGANGPNHALKFTVYAKEYLYNGSPKFRWPATTNDSYANGWYGTNGSGNSSTTDGTSGGSGTNNNSAMVMGSLLAISPSTSMASLSLETEPARQLFWTMQNFGGYIVDDRYSIGFGIATEEGPNGSFAGQFQSDFGLAFNVRISNNTPWSRDVQKLANALSVVNNNTKAFNDANQPAGGGTPRTPFPAPI